MGVMMTGQRVGMVIGPPTGGGLLVVEGWEGRCALRHLAQAGGNAGDIGRPAEQIWMMVVMFSSFNVSFHRRPGGHAAHGGVPVSRRCLAIKRRWTMLRRQCAGLPGAADSRQVDSLRFPKYR